MSADQVTASSISDQSRPRRRPGRRSHISAMDGPADIEHAEGRVGAGARPRPGAAIRAATTAPSEQHDPGDAVDGRS